LRRLQDVVKGKLEYDPNQKTPRGCFLVENLFP